VGGCQGKEETEETRNKKTIKVAILGTAASGKTTFFRQMHILWGSGFDSNENDNYIRILRSNFVSGMKELIQSCEELENNISKEYEDHVTLLKEYNYNEGAIPGDVMNGVKQLWEDQAIMNTWEKKDSLPNITIINFDYIVKQIDRLCEEGAVATNDDIVRCRQRTTGLGEIIFPYNKHYFHIFDVGGQKTERRKWDVLSTTQKPTAVLFFTSLIDFDIPLLTENSDETRMDESIEVWMELLDKEELQTSTIILLLNKCDLFEDKIKKVNMKDTFQDFDGDNDYDKGCEYIKKKFMTKAQENKKHDVENIHTHITCAIDTEIIKNVFEAVAGEIFKQRLAMNGLNPIF